MNQDNDDIFNDINPEVNHFKTTLNPVTTIR